MARSRNLAFSSVTLACACGHFFCAPAMAQSDQRVPRAVPVLQGTYVFEQAITCAKGKGVPAQTSGSLNFDSGAGKFKLNAYTSQDDFNTLDRLKQSGTYSNSGATVTFGTVTYQATYGKLEKGTATYASLIAAGSGCASRIALSRK